MTGVCEPNTLEMPRKLMREEVPACADVALTVMPATLPCSSWAMSCTGARSISCVLITCTDAVSFRRSTSRPVPVTTISSSEIADRANVKLAVAACPTGTVSVCPLPL